MSLHGLFRLESLESDSCALWTFDCLMEHWVEVLKTDVVTAHNLLASGRLLVSHRDETQARSYWLVP